jgi:hypothetical protein
MATEKSRKLHGTLKSIIKPCHIVKGIKIQENSSPSDNTERKNKTKKGFYPTGVMVNASVLHIIDC